MASIELKDSFDDYLHRWSHVSHQHIGEAFNLRAILVANHIASLYSTAKQKNGERLDRPATFSPRMAPDRKHAAS